MAKLPSETVRKILILQQQFLEKIDEAGLLESRLFEEFGETEETLPELEELQSIRERSDSYYSRFHIMLRRIYESQPLASADTLNLLTRYIDEADATIEAVEASIQDIKRNWNLP